MMKHKELKQWVLEKRRSLTEKFVVSRQDSQSQSKLPPHLASDHNRGEHPLELETGDDKVPGMEIDNMSQNDTKASQLTKTKFAVKWGKEFCIDARYSYIKMLGLGAHGVVCSANDSKTGKRMAVKKVAGVFNDLTDAKRIIREIRLLRHMNHDNILKVVDIDEPEDYTTFNDVYIVTELMDINLYELIHSSTKMHNSHRKFFVYHLLKALKYIHSANIFHRDLKPANILVSSSCDIKICDFGLARYVGPEEASAQNMTEYVVTRWYRAPELLLSSEEYTSAIDMWSAGCILVELNIGRTLFAGNGVQDQLEMICGVLGKPTAEEISRIQHRRAREFMESLSDEDGWRLESIMSNADSQAFDLAKCLLQFDPAKRLTAAQALEHPYVQEYRDVKSETTAEVIDREKLEPPSEKTVGRDGIRRLMWNEMLHFHPDARAREPPAAKIAQEKLDKALNAM